MPEVAMLVESPVFLVSAERSGTTLLRLMLDSHPEVAWCSEFEYAVDHLAPGGIWPEMDRYRQWLGTNRVFQDTGFSVDPELGYPELVNSFLIQKQVGDRKNMVGATVHRHLDRLKWVWPEARFIHMVRDPRDVARSCVDMGWAGNVWTGVARWLHTENLWEEIRAEIPPDRYVQVRYEDLILDPEPNLERICDFLGVRYDRAMLGYPETTTYDPPDVSRVNQWKRKLSDRQVRLVEARVGALLVDRGYEPSGLPPLKVTPVMAKRLRLRDWWGRVRFRVKRFGLGLFLSDFLSRRLGMTRWQGRVRQRMNEIETQFLE